MPTRTILPTANIAKGGLTVQSSTGTMMERVSSGENLIGYNILGSYAEARAKTILFRYCLSERLRAGALPRLVY